MVTISELPDEILAHIASFLIPEELATCNRRSPWTDTCVRMAGLRSLRCVFRAWYRCAVASIRTCVSHDSLSISSGDWERALTYSPDDFRAAYDRIPYPKNVGHLHLGTSRRHLQYIDLYLSAFPSLSMVEIGEWNPNRWHELAKALAFAPSVTKIIWCFEGWGLLRSRALPKRPSGSARPLRHVKHLELNNAGPAPYLDSFLEWFPEITSLKLHMGTTGIQASGIEDSLRHSRSSLKHLTIDKWIMCGYVTALEEQIVDLRYMEALEELSIGSIHANSGNGNNVLRWELPQPVTKVHSTDFRGSPFKWNKSLVDARCVQEYVESLLAVAPGLKELTVQPVLQDERSSWWERFHIRLWHAFDEKGVRLVLKDPLNEGPSLRNPSDIRKAVAEGYRSYFWGTGQIDST